MRFIVTCSTSCSFLLKTLVISFHSLYPPLQSFSIFTSLSVVLNPCWLFLRASSRSRWPRPPLSSLPVSPHSPPNPFLCLFDTHTLCPSILLSAHPPIYFHHSFLPPLLPLYPFMLPWPLLLTFHPSLFTPSLHFPSIRHSSPSCLCQSELPGIHLEEVLLSELDSTSPTLSWFTHNTHPA